MSLCGEWITKHNQWKWRRFGGKQTAGSVFTQRHWTRPRPSHSLFINNQPVTGREIWSTNFSSLVLISEGEVRVRSGYSPTTLDPPHRPPRSPRPQRTSARLGYQPHSYTWPSRASASGYQTRTCQLVSCMANMCLYMDAIPIWIDWNIPGKFSWACV